MNISFWAQDLHFKTDIDIEATSVKSQGHSGTCWSFATSSFIESEIYRIDQKFVDVSEMFTVRNIYEQKAWDYVMRQGKTQLSEGGLAHDVIHAISDYGLAPQSAFTDVFGVGKVYNHAKVIPEIKQILDAYIKDDIHSAYPDWKKAIQPVLDSLVGKKITSFTYDNKTFTPVEFRDYLHIHPEDYVSLTSFTHRKYYSEFVLNIPDNFSNGSFYNLPLNELVEIVNSALKKGYSIALDVDVSEKTFDVKKGLATLPDTTTVDLYDELKVSPEWRQKEFEIYNTTDDHLMHITGLVEDQFGHKYYKVKNSWGSNSKRVGNNGFIYMSIPYFKLKAISVLLHKDALDSRVKTLLKL